MENIPDVPFSEDNPPIVYDGNEGDYESNQGSTSFQNFENDVGKSLPVSEVIRTIGLKNPGKLLHHCLPITCLKLLEGIVLVASEGPSVLIKMAYFEECAFDRFQLFPNQCSISGMEFTLYPTLECGDNPVDWHKRRDKPYDHIYIGFCWAGSVGTVIRLTRTVKSGLKLLECVDGVCGNGLVNFDFIPVAAKWLEGGNILALLSVLNYVVIYERIEDSETTGTFTNLKELKRIRCVKSETLFSGKISGNSRNDIRILGGTIFNGVCVWDINGDEAVIKHELKCHDGIIFSLEYYSERKLLLSTSDDRTVAAWQFFENAEGQEEVTLLRRFYGHDARVWRALAIHGYLLSVGESSDVRVNILKDGTEHKSWRAHDGAPIFDCVYDQDVEILYTGGNDGSIRKWPKWWYRLKPRILPFDVIPFDTENDSKSRIQGSGRWSENKDYPKSATLLDLNHVIVSMESGRVVGMTWQGKQFDLLYDERCEGYSIIKISPDLKVLAVAGNNGHFYTAQISFSENESTKCPILHATKIFMTKISWNIISMIWLDVSRLLIVCFNRVVALLLQDAENGERSEVQFIQTFELNLQRPGIPAAVEIHGKHIVFGDELGSLHLLRYHKSNNPISKFERAHRDGVTSLTFYNETLYTTGRDGLVRTFSIKINSENDMIAEIVPLNSVSVGFDWITGMFVNMTHMLVCGFQKEDFIVYSYNDKRTLAKIPCSGGGNRKWDFKYGHGEQGSRNASFTFVKDREIFYTYLPMEGYLNVVMKEGLHCRTINCAIEHKTSERNGIDYFTGSEDGTLKWFQWDVANQRILCIQNMQNHLSSVRSVCVVKDVSNRTLVFSGGGRSQLCIYSLDFINDTMELMKEIVLVKTTCKQTEGDVRIMDIAVIDGACQGSDDLWCFSACSDGYVRVLYYNAENAKFKIVGQLKGNAHAVMKIQLLKTSSSVRDVLICGVTSNGYWIVWSWNKNDAESLQGSNKKSVPEKSPHFIRLLRKTAFLSMKVIESPKMGEATTYFIVCGGDDCSVSLWKLEYNRRNDSIECDVSEVWTRDQIQRGAVVGVDIDNEYIYSLSNDQIVGFWNWSGELIQKTCAGVSDCQGFVVDKSNGCIMCFGKGVSWVPGSIIRNNV